MRIVKLGHKINSLSLFRDLNLIRN